MKTRFALLLLTSIPFVLAAAPEAAQVVERGLHHRVLQRVSRAMLEDGRVIEMTNSYTEIGNCLHYQKDGHWLESKAEFRLFPGGAVADAAPNQLIVAPDIAEEGSIDFLDSSGKRFLSTPRWLA